MRGPTLRPTLQTPLRPTFRVAPIEEIIEGSLQNRLEVCLVRAYRLRTFEFLDEGLAGSEAYLVSQFVLGARFIVCGSTTTLIVGSAAIALRVGTCTAALRVAFVTTTLIAGSADCGVCVVVDSHSRLGCLVRLCRVGLATSHFGSDLVATRSHVSVASVAGLLAFRGGGLG